MKTKKKVKRMTPAEQHARFVEAAYKVEADQATDAMDKAFGKINPRSKSPITPKPTRS
jgi:hypothetical protein